MNRCCCLDVGKGSLVGGIQADKRNKMMEESSTASECRVIHLSSDSVHGRNGPCSVSSQISDRETGNK